MKTGKQMSGVEKVLADEATVPPALRLIIAAAESLVGFDDEFSGGITSLQVVGALMRKFFAVDEEEEVPFPFWFFTFKCNTCDRHDASKHDEQGPVISRPSSGFAPCGFRSGAIVAVR